MFNTLKTVTRIALAAGLIFASSSVWASGSAVYHVTITNITNGINFTPILVASHRHKIPLFELGMAASEDITAIAEGGDVSGLAETLGDDPQIVDVQIGEAPSDTGLLEPGQSVTVVVSAAHGARRISMAAMMLPTNDGMIALNGVKAPRHGSAVYFSPGYDGGTEPNDEWCVNIPGPTCGGDGPSPGINPDDEGYVHIHRGIHGVGNLVPTDNDWRNPVAKITITRIRGH